MDKCCKKIEEIKILFSSRHDGEKLIDDRGHVGDNVNKTQKNEQGKASKNKSFLVDQSDRTSLNRQKTPNTSYLNATDDKEIEDDKDLDWLLDDPLSKSVFGVRNEREGITDMFDPVNALHTNSQTFENSNKGGKIASSDMSQTFVLSDCIQTSPQRLPKVDSGIIVDQEGRQESDDEFNDCFPTDSSMNSSTDSSTHQVSSSNKQTNTLANKTAEINNDLRCTSDQKAGRHFEHELETNVDKRHKDYNKYHTQSSDVVESDNKYHTQSSDVVESDNKYHTQSSDVVESDNKYHTQSSDVVESDVRMHKDEDETCGNRLFSCADLQENETIVKKIGNDTKSKLLRENMTLSKLDTLLKIITPFADNKVCASKILSRSRHCKLLGSEQIGNMSHFTTPDDNTEQELLNNSENAELNAGNMSHTTTREDNTGPELLDDSENVELRVNNHLKSGQFQPQGSSDEVNGRGKFDETTANCGSTSYDKLLSDKMDKKFITLSLGLGHGSEAIMKCILEARRSIDCQRSDKMRWVNTVIPI